MNCQHDKKKLLTSYHIYHFYFCPDCELIFNNEGLEEKIEQKKYDEFYESNGSRFFSAIELAVLASRFSRAAAVSILCPGGKSILDIGCGRGYLLFFLKKYFSWQTAIGTQISAPALLFAKEKLGLDVRGQDLLDIDFGKLTFDVITILHVLEHIKNPEAYLEKMYSLLKPGGKIIIEVPNYNSWTRKITNRFWLGLDFQHHIFFFTPASLKKLLVKYHFTILKTKTFSWEYSTFTSAQSLLSRLTKSDQLFYNFIQTKSISLTNLLHSLLFIIIFPICLLINLLLFNSDSGENLRIVALKK